MFYEVAGSILKDLDLDLLRFAKKMLCCDYYYYFFFTVVMFSSANGVSIHTPLHNPPNLM